MSARHRDHHHGFHHALSESPLRKGIERGHRVHPTEHPGGAECEHQIPELPQQHPGQDRGQPRQHAGSDHAERRRDGGGMHGGQHLLREGETPGDPAHRGRGLERHHAPLRDAARLQSGPDRRGETLHQLRPLHRRRSVPDRHGGRGDPGGEDRFASHRRRQTGPIHPETHRDLSGPRLPGRRLDPELTGLLRSTGRTAPWPSARTAKKKKRRSSSNPSSTDRRRGSICAPPAPTRREASFRSSPDPTR